MNLTGRVVAVTGGARGIGLATAEALANRGARVAIGDLDPSLTAAAAEKIGRRSLGLPLDVREPSSFETFLDTVESRLGPLYGLVNNAGIMVLGPFDREAEAVTDKMIDVNVHGVLTGSRLAMQRMKARGDGHIVNVASMAGKTGLPGAATYCATKYAVVGFTEAIRAELRGTGVFVSCVMPGVVNTELTLGLVATGRRVKNIEPFDVAVAIARAFEERRFEVFVPEALGVASKVLSVLPLATRERIFRMVGGEDVLAKVDPVARARYAERVAADLPPSSPGRHAP